MMNLREILGLVYAMGALLMLWSALRSTRHFGLRTKDELWALMRRVVYWLMTFALGGLAIASYHPVSALMDFMLHLALLAGVLFFPFMRALGFITQDTITWGRSGNRLI